MSTNDPNAICGTCRFWFTSQGKPKDPPRFDRDGECRVNPPQPIKRSTLQSLNVPWHIFPSISECEWCGKHEWLDSHLYVIEDNKQKALYDSLRQDTDAT